MRQYNWHRFYDPSLGRYISADPIGQRGGIYVFGYAANNPLMNIDPWGLLSYLVPRQANVGSSGGIVLPTPGDHLYIATNADFPGDPEADIISFGPTDLDLLVPIDIPRDRAHWEALANQCTDTATSALAMLITASDEAVQKAAQSFVADQSYIPYGPAAMNSNTAAQAVANEASQASVFTPASGTTLGPVGAGRSSSVRFAR